MVVLSISVNKECMIANSFTLSVALYYVFILTPNCLFSLQNTTLENELSTIQYLKAGMPFMQHTPVKRHTIVIQFLTNSFGWN